VILLRAGGRRATCWCVRVAERGDLPAADRAAHLLLALREDERGFAKVANFEFSGAARRVRRHLPEPARTAFDAAREGAGTAQPPCCTAPLAVRALGQSTALLSWPGMRHFSSVPGTERKAKPTMTTAPPANAATGPTGAEPLPPIDEEQIAAWRAFLRANTLMLRQIAEDLGAAGLPPLAWYDVLWALYEAPERRLQNYELADAILLSRSGLSRLVDRIAAAGLVRRTTCPDDRRGIHIELTERGVVMLERMWPVYARGIAQHFAPALGEHACSIREAFESVAHSLRGTSSPRC
jgi:DNA-binding MarR family transcriptional regulator